MAQDLIRYDVLAQEAFRGLVRKVLTEVAHAGLPGDHHFFISFDTRAPGVRISSRLRERYPEEMTIVLQHEYWELVVNDQAFEVSLSFSRVPERLYIPFTALKGFFDPSVEFAVTFPLVGEDGQPADAVRESPADKKPAAPAPVAALKSVETKAGPVAVPAAVPQSAVKADDPAKGDAAKEDSAKGDVAKDEGKSASVVSLDAFRKKT